MFGVLVKEMKSKGITQKELAEKIGVSQSAVAFKLMHGDFKSEEMIKIQDAFFPDTDMRTLFTKI